MILLDDSVVRYAIVAVNGWLAVLYSQDVKLDMDVSVVIDMERELERQWANMNVARDCDLGRCFFYSSFNSLNVIHATVDQHARNGQFHGTLVACGRRAWSPPSHWCHYLSDPVSMLRKRISGLIHHDTECSRIGFILNLDHIEVLSCFPCNKLRRASVLVVHH